MTSPKHLWSGNWWDDSAAAAEQLARRRAQSAVVSEEEEAEPSPAQRPQGPSIGARILATIRNAVMALIAGAGSGLRALRDRVPGADASRRRRVATLIVVALLTLLSAGVAFAVTSYLLGTGHHSSQTAGGTPAWLGINMQNDPQDGGVKVLSVAPNSPARAAGILPGDLITAINNQPVHTADEVNAALDGLVPGNTIQVQFNRAASSYSTLVTLTSRPQGGP